MSDQSNAQPWTIRAILIFIIIPIILGVVIASFISRPIIGLVYLDDAIYSSSAQEIILQMQTAADNPRIKAVVFILNTPGGTVADSESVYFEINRLRQHKPVVTMVEGMAASGGYYLAVGTDYIYAKPGSIVGNIGVIGYVPETPTVMEGIYSTGPYKMWSEPRDKFIRELEVQKEGFYEAVRLGRGETLQLSKEEVLSGQIWLGNEAQKNGIIDALGSTSLAYEKAASMARISHYEVKDLRSLAGLAEKTISTQPFFTQTSEGINTGYPKNPGLYMLYIPSMEVQP